MNLHAQAWRPLGDADERIARDRLQQPVADFSARWFATGALTVKTAVVMRPGAPVRAALHPAGALALEGDDAVFGELACRAMDLGAAERARLFEPGSAALVRAMASRLRQDLIEVLKAMVAGSAPTGELPALGLGAVRVSLEFDQATSAAVWVPLTVSMGWHPTTPVRPAPGTATAERRELALATTSVRVEAVLGCARLAAASLLDLAVGDVLVLDQTLAEPCQLREAASRRALASARLHRSAGRYAVEMRPL
jgi:flagellar motor switch/type III secretory pathway protein FliN